MSKWLCCRRFQAQEAAELRVGKGGPESGGSNAHSRIREVKTGEMAGKEKVGSKLPSKLGFISSFRNLPKVPLFIRGGVGISV